MCDKKGAKSSERDHNDSNAGFHELPKNLPGHVHDVGGSPNSRYFNNRGEDHYNEQAQRKTKGELQLQLGFYAPKNNDRDDND